MFLTPQQITNIRLKGSTVIRVEELDKELRIIRLSSNASLKSQELQAAVNQGKAKPTDTILFMLENALAQLDGTPLTAADAALMFDLLTVQGITELVNKISAHIGDGSRVAKAAQNEELTPAEKKD